MPRLRDTKRNKDGTFGVGNGGGTGTPPKRERLDERVRYRLEAPIKEQIDVSFTYADKFALKLRRSLEAVEDGQAFVKTLKDAKELAYGAKTETDLSGTVFGAIERRILKPTR